VGSPKFWVLTIELMKVEISAYWLSRKNLKLLTLDLPVRPNKKECPSLIIIPGLVSCMDKLEEREKKK
jgi:hypothetical protein